MSGSSSVCWRRTNAVPAITPATIESTGVIPRPFWAVSFRPKMTASTATSDSAALGRSGRPAPGSRYSGNMRGPRINNRTITGSESRKTDPHQNSSSASPPTSGPMAPPTEKLVIQIAIAVLRCRASRNMVRISESVEGASVAPAMPSTARDAINISVDFENAARIDAAPNAAAPIMSSRRRPMRSPRVPIVIREPATRKP